MLPQYHCVHHFLPAIKQSKFHICHINIIRISLFGYVIHSAADAHRKQCNKLT